MAQTSEQTLLDPALMSKLEQLELLTRKIFRGSMKGERRSKRRGESVEFADFRNYVAGDDLRFLDWNAYARLDKLFLKLFLEEEDLHVSVLFDTSKSMDWGKPVTKGLYAKRLAAALAYIGLCNYDRVSLYAFSDFLQYEMKGMRGRRMAAEMLQFVQSIEFGGGSNLENTCKHYAIRHPQRGVVIVLSDFLDKAGFETGLRYLLGRNLDLYVIQILSADELEPTLTGDLKLRDVEDDDLAEITVTRALINRYKHNVQTYCQSLKDYCGRRGVNYIFATPEVDVDQLVLKFLRRRGLVK
ncbi:MAG: DUF58 domain-containing protein [Planctomycetes bacterium]|nr:DUF58 domain-containing protein [Planctomycetota bacterium]